LGQQEEGAERELRNSGQPTEFVSWDTKRLNPGANVCVKPEPPKRGIAGAVVDLAELVLSSRGSLSEDLFPTASGEFTLTPEQTKQEAAAKQQSQVSMGPPRWRFGDLLLGRAPRVPEKKSKVSSRNSREIGEVYVEAQGEQGSYLRRVSAE